MAFPCYEKNMKTPVRICEAAERDQQHLDARSWDRTWEDLTAEFTTAKNAAERGQDIPGSYQRKNFTTLIPGYTCMDSQLMLRFLNFEFEFSHFNPFFKMDESKVLKPAVLCMWTARRIASLHGNLGAARGLY
jgi:hypothetical protein